MILGIFDGFAVLGDLIMPLIDFIGNGIKQLIDFIINLPEFFNNVINIIPAPLYTVVYSFIGIIIMVIVLKVVK